MNHIRYFLRKTENHIQVLSSKKENDVKTKETMIIIVFLLSHWSTYRQRMFMCSAAKRKYHLGIELCIFFVLIVDASFSC